MVDRRDTPAQERAFQTRTNRDWSALQQGVSYLNDRDAERDAVAGAVRAATQRDPGNRGNSGSPTPGRVASAIGGALDGGAPNTGPAITQREVDQNYSSAAALRDLRRNAPPAATSTQQVTEADGRGVSMNPGGVLSALRRGLGSAPAPAGPGAPTRMPQREGPSLVQRATDYLTRVPSGTGMGQNTPAGAGGYRVGQSQQGQTPATGTGQPNVATVNPSALSGAVQAGGDAANMGYWQAGNGPRQYIPGTQQSSGGISVMGDMGAANEQFAQANAIRQQTIDRQRPQNQVTVIPNTGIGGGREGGLSDVEKEIMRLAERAGRTRNTRDRARINSQIRALQSVADRQADIRANAASNATSLQRQQMADNSAWERAAMNAMTTDEGQALYNQARANYYNQRARSIAQGEPLAPPEMPDVEGFLATGREDLAEQAILNYVAAQDEYDLQTFARENGVGIDELRDLYMEGEMPPGRISSIMERMYGPLDEGEDRSYAQGGMVAPPTMEETMGPSAAGMQMGGEPVGFGAAQPPMMQEYERYAAGAQQIGVPAVPYEDFVNLMPQAQPMPQAAPGQTEQYGRMGFAEGGIVPGQEDMLATQIGATMGGEDVSGREVFDPNPMAPTDSIPAVIDGQIPAALDSGEFVIPEHVVRYHGLEKLQKLIAQADKGASNGQSGAETASSSVRA